MKDLEERLRKAAAETALQIGIDPTDRYMRCSRIINAFRILLKQVRDEALEEAAGVCEARGERLSDSDDHWGPEYANRVRALKEQNNG